MKTEQEIQKQISDLYIAIEFYNTELEILEKENPDSDSEKILRLKRRVADLTTTQTTLYHVLK